MNMKEQNRIDTLRVNNAYYDMFGYGDINSSGGLVMEKQLSDESRKILIDTFEDIAKSKETATCEFCALQRADARSGYI